MRTSSTMALPSSILAGLLLFSLTSAQTDNGNECSCFRTNGSSAGYFTYHRFFDYRNVPGASAAPPAVVSNEINATDAFATSDFFLNDAWRNDWTIQNWNNSDSMSSTDATELMINSPNNVYIGTFPLPPRISLLTIQTREKQRYIPQLHLLPHPPNVAPSLLPIRRRNRFQRKELSIPLRAVPGPRHWLPRRLRRHVHLPCQRQLATSARSGHRDPDRRPPRHGTIHEPTVPGHEWECAGGSDGKRYESWDEGLDALEYVSAGLDAEGD